MISFPKKRFFVTLKEFSGQSNNEAGKNFKTFRFKKKWYFSSDVLYLAGFDDRRIRNFLHTNLLKESEDSQDCEIITKEYLLNWHNRKVKNVDVPDDCLNILTDSNLWGIMDKELDKKIQGEYQARKAVFFTFNMRNVANLSKATDNLMVNDEGGTGKDYIVAEVFNLIPDGEKIKKVRISPKVLGYLNDSKTCPSGWVKKCLYLEDVPNSVLNDDCFKVMCSSDTNGITESSIVVNNSLKNINIKGKPSIVITIASSNPKIELLRRFPIVNLTGSTEQTKAVLEKQAMFAMDGKIAEIDQSIINALKYIIRKKVKIPFANKIHQYFPSSNVIVRTHFNRFLDYIKSSCVLHQYQRKEDEKGVLIADVQDYDIARDILNATTSNQFMIPLTKNQKNIITRLTEIENKPYTFQELEVELQSIPLGSRWLRTQIEKLVEYGFIKRRNEKRDHSIKPVAVYIYTNIFKLSLPSFEEIQKGTYSTPNTICCNFHITR